MWVIFLGFLLCGPASVFSAMTDAEVKLDFTKIALSCTKDHPVDMEDMVKLKGLVLPDKREVKCLLACAYRKYGTLNKEGKFDKDKSYELAEKTKEGDADAIARGKKLADVCLKVNDASVSDGAAGCEISGLMFKCVVENAPKFGFTV